MTDKQDPLAEEEAHAAAQEAGAIGGESGMEGFDEAERPVAEAGGGVAEGFELAEDALVDRAENFGEPGRNPAPTEHGVEAEENPSTYGEADEVHQTDQGRD